MPSEGFARHAPCPYSTAMTTRPLVIAHRGDSAHAPENTMPAFEAAIAQGADWIELDLLLSRDDQLVVCHDEELSRLARVQARVRDLDAAALATTDVGSHKSTEFKGVGIPLLSEVLLRIGSRTPLYLEMKSSGYGRRDRDSALLLAKCLQMVPRHSPHALASFDLGLVRGAVEDGRRAVLIVADPSVIGRLSARELRALHAVSVRHDVLDEPLARRILAGGPHLWAWTLDDERAVRRAVKLGVSGVCGNDVAALRAVAFRLQVVALGSGAPDRAKRGAPRQRKRSRR
jgi:glycerophosphoryl diester phosphodiesterase